MNDKEIIKKIDRLDTKLSLLLETTKPVRFTRAQLLKKLGISWRRFYQIVEQNGLMIPRNREDNGGNNPTYSMATYLKIKELLEE